MESNSTMPKEDITKRLLNACNGWPNTTVSWPHRLLHEAREEIEKLRATPPQPSVEEVTPEQISKNIQIWRFDDSNEGSFGDYLMKRYPHGLKIVSKKEGGE